MLFFTEHLTLCHGTVVENNVLDSSSSSITLTTVTTYTSHKASLEASRAALQVSRTTQEDGGRCVYDNDKILALIIQNAHDMKAMYTKSWWLVVARGGGGHILLTS